MLGLAIPPGAIVGVAGAMLAPPSGSATVNTVFAIMSGLAGLGTVLGIIYGVRYKIAYAVEVKAREGDQALFDALDDRLRLVVHERDELAAKLDKATLAINEATKTIARLEGLPNLERVLEIVGDTFTRLGAHIDDRFDSVERRLDRLDNAA